MQVKSSRVGWPFWIPVILTAIPFTVLFGVFATNGPHDPIPWWEWIFAIPIGLTPALLLGLVVQTLWSIGIAAKQKRFTLLDGLFAVFLLALGGILGWICWRNGVPVTDTIIGLYFFLVLLPLVRIYVRKRSKQSDDAVQ